MDKKRDLGGKLKYIAFLIFSSLLVAGSILFYVFSVVSLLVFLVSLVVSLLLFSLSLVLFAIKKKRKIEKVETHSLNKGLSEEDLIGLYKKVGIPVIYDENGNIKDIFELLKLEVKW